MRMMFGLFPLLLFEFQADSKTKVVLQPIGPVISAGHCAFRHNCGEIVPVQIRVKTQSSHGCDGEQGRKFELKEQVCPKVRPDATTLIDNCNLANIVLGVFVPLPYHGEGRRQLQKRANWPFVSRFVLCVSQRKLNIAFHSNRIYLKIMLPEDRICQHQLQGGPKSNRTIFERKGIVNHTSGTIPEKVSPAVNNEVFSNDLPFRCVALRARCGNAKLRSHLRQRKANKANQNNRLHTTGLVECFGKENGTWFFLLLVVNVR